MQIDLPYAVSEDELRHSLGLAGYTTGKGKPALDPNIRAIEVFMCSVVSRHHKHGCTVRQSEGPGHIWRTLA